MNRKQRNIKIFILGCLVGFVLMLFLIGCGSSQAPDVDMDTDMEVMCPKGFNDCREMTERELVIWFFTIDCLKDIDLFPVSIDADSIEPPLIREEEDRPFLCGDTLAFGCAHLNMNLIRIPAFDVFLLEVLGQREDLFSHEQGHILLFLASNDISHESIFYTDSLLCLNPSRDLF